MPTANHGKICYIELPTLDLAQSIAFYTNIFGWEVRTRDDGSTAFDDSTGQVSGSFDTTRKAVDHPGLIVSIMVEDIRAALAQIESHGGQITNPLGYHPTELAAHFRDPGGNILGLYQEPG